MHIFRGFADPSAYCNLVRSLESNTRKKHIVVGTTTGNHQKGVPQGRPVVLDPYGWGTDSSAYYNVVQFLYKPIFCAQKYQRPINHARNLGELFYQY